MNINHFAWIVRRRNYNKAVKAAWDPKKRTIEGYGDVHIKSMPIPMRLALNVAIEEQSSDQFEIYCWMVSELVEELRHRPPHKIGIELPSQVIIDMGDAVLEVSDMTKESREKSEKKSESSRALSSSITSV